MRVAVDEVERLKGEECEHLDGHDGGGRQEVPGVLVKTTVSQAGHLLMFVTSKKKIM